MTRQLLLLAILLGSLGAVSAQEVSETNELNQQLVSARIQKLRDAGGQEGSDTTLDGYQQVLNWLGEAEAHKAAEKTYLDSQDSAPQIESEIRARMETADYDGVGTDSASVSRLRTPDIETKLSELRVQLRDAGTARDTLDRRIATEQSSAPNIQARLEAIDSRIRELPADVITIEPGLQPSQFEASQWSVLAERMALVAERRSLEARLRSQPVRYSRRKAESDEFTLKITGLQNAIQTLELELAGREQKRETESSVSLDAQAAGYSFVQRLVAENAKFRAQRVELDAALTVLKTENALVQQTGLSLQEQYDAVQQIVALAKNSPSLGHVLMAHWHQADSFRTHVTELYQAEDIGGYVIQRAEYEELQAKLSNTSAYVMNGFAVEDVDPELEIDEAALEAAKTLVRKQRDLLTELNAIETELINVHGTIDRNRQQYGARFKEYQDYLGSRILWVPSHPTFSFPTPEKIKQELGRAAEVLSALFSAQAVPILGLLLVLLVAVLGLRNKLEQFQQSLNAKIGRPRSDSIRYTFGALLLTLVRCAVLPLLFFLMIASLDNSSSAAVWYLGGGLHTVSKTLFVILLLRLACAPTGIAPLHFGWSESVCKNLYRLTTTLLIWWWPLLLCSAFLLRIEVDSITAALGRLLLIIHFTILGVTLARFLWPGDPVNTNYRRVRYYASFFTVATMLFLIVCGIAGYLYSAKVVWDALINSLVIAVMLIFFYFLLRRWLLVVRRRLRFRELLAARAALDDDEESPVEPEVNDLVTLSESIEKLLKVGTSLLFLLAGGYYWSPLFSGLEALQRVTLWTVSDVSGGETSITLASVALALLFAFITYYAATSGSGLLELLLRGRKSVSPGSRYAVVKLLQYLFVGTGVIVVLSTLGVMWDRLQWLVAALGVGIGFGLQEIIANFICGLIILFERPIRVGDVITVGESSGEVIRITIRATTIRDFDGKELLVPNKEFITGRLLNWTLSNTNIRMILEVGIAYGSDVRKAQSILLDLIKNHEMILDDPEPDVLFREFGNSSLNLSARYFFSDVAKRGYLLNDLHLKIYDAFAEAGIVIAFPQIDVHMASDKPDQADAIAPLQAG